LVFFGAILEPEVRLEGHVNFAHRDVPRGRTLTIGDEAVIGAGAIVVDDVPAGAVVLPEPSRVVTRTDASYI
jgi:carbonic anhydrase/acetyltransferase-like protein (isoleucine patch superfamily)